jgi:hypothetical protein
VKICPHDHIDRSDAKFEGDELGVGPGRPGFENVHGFGLGLPVEFITFPGKALQFRALSL